MATYSAVGKGSPVSRKAEMFSNYYKYKLKPETYFFRINRLTLPN